MTLAKFTIDQQPAKPLWKSKTFWVNAVVLLISIMPGVQEFLQTLPGGEEIAARTVQLVVILNLVLRTLTGGPVSGAAGAIGYGFKAGTKKLVNVLPGVNVK